MLLGPPGSGKSAFLNLIAGRLRPTSKLHISGEVRYSGRDLDTFQPARVVAFVEQQDCHLSTLSVEQTIEFAYQCQQVQQLGKKGSSINRASSAKLNDIEQGSTGIGSIHGGGMSSGNHHKGPSIRELWDRQDKRTLMERVFGLEQALETRVGDAFTRGISGRYKPCKLLYIATLFIIKLYIG